MMRMIRLNMVTPARIMAAAPLLLRKGGCIVNITSSCIHSPEADVGLYGATKAGLLYLTKAYARKYAKQGIRVNAISPGLTRTMLAGSLKIPAFLYDRVPMGRAQEPHELGLALETCIYSKFMTGAEILVDGGEALFRG